MDVCRSNPPQQAPEATSFAANKLSVQSYRRSCDRCHVQKLKCSRNTRSPTQCQRCERAGHKCVYSQRNPRQSTRVKGSASSAAARGGAGQSHQLPIPAGGDADDASSDKLSPEWPGTLDGDAVDLLQEWTWQDFTGGPLGEYHDLLGQTLYSPQTTSTPPSAKEGTNIAAASEQQDVFERLSSISKTLEDYVHFLANQWDRKEIQNYPIGEVFGTFQAFLTTLQVQRPILEKPGVLEGCQRTRTVLLASHCYTVCVKIMEALAETLCQDMSTQASQNALRQPPPGDVIPASGAEVDFLVGESFSHLHPLASSLVSACTTLHTGVGILCKVEVELGVPWGNSIMAREALPAEGDDGDALFPSSQRRKGSAGFTQAARFLGVMREGAGSDFGYISNLQNFHRHHAEILRLTRQHTVCFLSKILSPQTTRT